MELAVLLPLTVFGGVVIATVALHALLDGQKRSVRERLERYEAREKEAAPAKATPNFLRDRRFSIINWLDRLLHGTDFAERMALDLAGASVPLRVSAYIFIRWLLALVPALLVLALGSPWFMALAAGAAGFFGPKLYLNRQRQQRVKKTVHQLMDAIGLISNSLKSGYSFGQGLELVTREMPPPIADEFHQVLVEMNLGGSVEEAMASLARRVPSYDIDLMVTAFVVQRQVGGNLAEVLDSIAHTIRERIRILGEVRARTTQARLSGYVVGFMPFFLMGAISVLNPAYIQEMLASRLGTLMLGAAVGLELVGFLLIRRIVAIEV